jgi:uncharacterized protein (TIGR03032 family)
MSARVSGRAIARGWRAHAIEWRAPAQIASQWRDAAAVDAHLLETRPSRGWWALLARLGVTLFVSREYEHLMMALSVRSGRPRVSYMAMPHPSGVAADRRTRKLHIASTRNPNQVYTLAPASGMLVPVESSFYPGRLYLHDLAVVGRKLYANGVGLNAVVELQSHGVHRPVWWPRCIERRGTPVLDRNHIQLNSIAAGRTIRDSFFSASSTSLDRLRPGHLNYPVDRRGVVFSGRTREPICTGLTRPHSARLARRRLWVANSGYGELGYVSGGRLEVVRRLPGWPRGLCLIGSIAFVGISRVIPRYARYAPGLDADASRCGVQAIDTHTGELVASLDWPAGNQVFAIDWMPDTVTGGFVFDARRGRRAGDAAFFYRYTLDRG